MNLARVVLAIFLLVFGVNILLGMTIPIWIIGALAVAAGALLLIENFRLRIDRK
ncbi:MAG TPA: hypothetical protein VHD32_09740 [Candidatus Didemnitutus sp.]|nr:hypothetical protein [Candidatus Didemnitutus sp.]